MNRAVVVTAGLLLFCGGSSFLYKHLVLGMALVPDPSARVWRVDFEVSSTPGTSPTGQIEVLLPRSSPHQVLLDEQSFDAGLKFSIRESENDRRAVWFGDFSESPIVAYSLRVYVPKGSGRFRAPDSFFQEKVPLAKALGTAAPEYAAILEKLGIDRTAEPDAIIATTFGFVAFEIESAAQGSHDPRVVLTSREGSIEGKTNLLLELLSAAGVEARERKGLRLHRAGRGVIEPFIEAQVGTRVVPLLVTTDGPHRFPKDFLTLSSGALSPLSVRGVSNPQLEITLLRESLPPEELASFVSPSSPFWRSISLYRLPISTRSVLEILLVIPLGVLVAAMFRNLIGIRTFGTFMPMLIALSLRETSLTAGLTLIVGCLTAGVVGRLMLDRLRLLFVPRVCLLLSIVVVTVTGLSLLGHSLQVRSLGQGLLFPIVILAMLIERISVTTLEEGWSSSFKLLGGSFALAAMTYPLFRSSFLSHLFLGFPELILVVMSALVLVGGYTGFRIMELWRFRSLAEPNERAAA